VLLDNLVSALNLGLGVFLAWRRPFDGVARLLGLAMVGTAAAFNLQAHIAFATVDRDVVDDEPLTRRDLTHATAGSMGKRWTLRVPTPVVRVTQPAVAPYIGLSMRVSNRRFKDVSDWQP
jgi:hypothetical protein